MNMPPVPPEWSGELRKVLKFSEKRALGERLYKAIRQDETAPSDPELRRTISCVVSWLETWHYLAVDASEEWRYIFTGDRS